MRLDSLVAQAFVLGAEQAMHLAAPDVKRNDGDGRLAAVAFVARPPQQSAFHSPSVIRPYPKSICCPMTF
jgi:hypothetical protein